jgi:hypothetical protein
VEVRKNIKYICNSCDGNNPIGCILDLWVYSHLASFNFISEAYNIDDEIYKFEFPDNLIDLIRVKNGS